MTIAKTVVVLAGLLTATSCMRNDSASNDRQTDIPRGGATTETVTSTAHATTPLEPKQPLNHVERADQLIGEQVLTADNQSTGKMDDFVIDQDSGRILFAIVGMGGVLGIGETRVAVPPGLFIEAKKGSVEINSDKHKLARAPQVSADVEKQPTADFLKQVYGYFGQRAWWEGLSPASV